VAIDERLRAQRDQILRLAALHGAREIRVFGSASRESSAPPGDIDVLVEFEHGRSLLDHVALSQDLEDLLGSPVDLVTPNALHSYIRERVLAEAVPL
jgi:predicted nucleotidyltransferase